jgi:hypothetical protein
MKSGFTVGLFCFGLLSVPAHGATSQLNIVGDAQISSGFVDFGQYPTGAPYAPAPGYGTFNVTLATGSFALSGVVPGEFGMIQSLNEGTGAVTLPGAFMTFASGGSNLQFWATNIPAGTAGPFTLTDTPTGATLFFTVEGNVFDTNTNTNIGTFTMNASTQFAGTTVSQLLASFPLNTPFSAIIIETPGVAGAVPEPASWSLMLLGFGAIGLATRRKRTAALAAA